MGAVEGRWAYNEDQVDHGGHPVSILTFVMIGEFWFQSMENWQIESPAVATLAVRALFLGQQGSLESKPWVRRTRHG